jgi:hypothetical protein
MEDRILGHLYVDISEPELKYIVVQPEGGPLICLPPDGAAFLVPARPVRLVDIRTNLPAEADVKAYLSRAGKDRRRFPLDRPVKLWQSLDGADRIELLHNRQLIGSIRLAGTASPKTDADRNGSRASVGSKPSTANRPGDDS